jgi:hypothetical protein
VVRTDGVGTPVRVRLKPRARSREGASLAWLRYFFGRLLQVIGLVTTLVAATAFFGTASTLAMLRMMLIGVLFFVFGWLLARKDPRGE